MRENQNTKITGAKVVLVPYRREHVDKYHEWMQDEQLRQLTASEALTLEQEHQMQCNWAQDQDKCTFIILSKDTLRTGVSEVEAMVGDVNLFLTECDNVKCAELEVMIAESGHRRGGLGLEASVLMMQYGVDRLNVRRFFVKIGRSNHASIRLFREKLGFHVVSESDVFDEITLQFDIDQQTPSSFNVWVPHSQIDHYGIKQP